jgi:hypothetical protein
MDIIYKIQLFYVISKKISNYTYTIGKNTILFLNTEIIK